MFYAIVMVLPLAIFLWAMISHENHEYDKQKRRDMSRKVD